MHSPAHACAQKVYWWPRPSERGLSAALWGGVWLFKYWVLDASLEPSQGRLDGYDNSNKGGCVIASSIIVAVVYPFAPKGGCRVAAPEGATSVAYFRRPLSLNGGKSGLDGRV